MQLTNPNTGDIINTPTQTNVQGAAAQSSTIGVAALSSTNGVEAHSATTERIHTNSGNETGNLPNHFQAGDNTLVIPKAENPAGNPME